MSSATGKEKPASQEGVGGEGGSSSFGFGLNLFCGMLAATLALSL